MEKILRDAKLINRLKAMSLPDLGTLANTSVRLQVYYAQTSNPKGVDREIYIQSEIKKEISRRKI